MIYKNKIFRTAMTVFVIILCLLSLMPFVLLLSGSLTDEATLALYGYDLYPRKFSMDAYSYLWNLRAPIIRAYFMSFAITVFGTGANVVMTTLFAYPLSRKDLYGRQVISFFLFFTMLFNGGFVPTYLIYTRIFNISDTFAAMVVPYLMMNAFFVIMMRTYIMSNIPDEVIEAARIDGSSELRILTRIVMPMSRPIMATVALMAAIAYWNNWTNGVYFLSVRTELYGIQNVLNSVMANVTFLQSHSNAMVSTRQMPNVSIRMALAMIAVIPILAAYPFFQKYFVKGITVGSVKG